MDFYVNSSIGLVLFLLLSPLVPYIWWGLRVRRDEILASLKEPSIKLYFQLYQPGTEQDHLKRGEKKNPAKPLQGAFEKHYEEHFGRRHFIIPCIALVTVAGILTFWSSLSVRDWLSGQSAQSGHLPEIAVAAIMGAYVYVVYDLISRWNACSLTAIDIFWCAFRLGIAVPTGYALTGAVKTEIAAPVAFLLGAFPAGAIITFSRRIGAKALGQDAVPESSSSELLKLNGIDLRVTERLAAEGIYTPLQLAYTDPVKLTIRTNLGFTFLSDCASQALLYIYVSERFEDFRRASLRSSYEIRGLLLELKSPKDEFRSAAEVKFNAIAAQLNMPKDVLRNLVDEIGDDPYTEFLYCVFYQV